MASTAGSVIQQAESDCGSRRCAPAGHPRHRQRREDGIGGRVVARRSQSGSSKFAHLQDGLWQPCSRRWTMNRRRLSNGPTILSPISGPAGRPAEPRVTRRRAFRGSARPPCGNQPTWYVYECRDSWHRPLCRASLPPPGQGTPGSPRLGLWCALGAGADDLCARGVDGKMLASHHAARNAKAAQLSWSLLRARSGLLNPGALHLQIPTLELVPSPRSLIILAVDHV